MIGEAADEAEWSEHLDAFFGPEFGLCDGLFGAVGDVDGVGDDEVAAEFEVAAVIGLGLPATFWTTWSAAPPGAAPPPMMPLIPYLAMKFRPRSDAETTGCHHSTGCFGRGTRVISSSSYPR